MLGMKLGMASARYICMATCTENNCSDSVGYPPVFTGETRRGWCEAMTGISIVPWWLVSEVLMLCLLKDSVEPNLVSGTKLWAVEGDMAKTFGKAMEEALEWRRPFRAFRESDLSFLQVSLFAWLFIMRYGRQQQIHAK